ncbi:MAG: PEP-utilizing enzyme [Desulfobacterales bacterium]|jgi:pyruvate,water dikinase
MPEYQNGHRNLRPEPRVGVSQDEILSLIDQILGRYGLKPLEKEVCDKYLIKGRPVSPGVAVGTAVVIQRHEDLKRVRPDSILICSWMSPAYSTVFHVVGGVVSERGGIMSTTATVAREKGLPVVTRVQSAQRVISDGDLVRINGNEGSVQIVVKHCPNV